MIDIKRILEEPDLVAQNNKKRGKDLDLSVVTNLHQKRVASIEEVESLRRRSNEIASLIPQATEQERPALIAEGKEIKETLKGKESGLQEVEEQLRVELSAYPNILKEDVPVGADESANEVVRKVGEPTEFAFEPKDHLEIGEALDIIDMDRGAKVAGARFAYLKGDAVLLELALLQYAMSELVKEGFIPVIPPHMVSTKAMGAMGYLERGGEEEIYHLKNDDLVMIGTSEQAIGPMLMDEILEANKLPLRYVGFSPCYRREAGSYGKDTRGIIRVHQFDKIEMFSFTDEGQSEDEHAFLLEMQERLMKALKLPYRVLKLSSGDTGSPSAKTYDIETWIPSQKTYRETHSTSNTTDYQTRRLNTRIKDQVGKRLAHALNGTAFAVGRIIVAILENNQQEDGSVVVPEVLRTYVGKDVIKNS